MAVGCDTACLRTSTVLSVREFPHSFCLGIIESARALIGQFLKKKESSCHLCPQLGGPCSLALVSVKLSVVGLIM